MTLEEQSSIEVYPLTLEMYKDMCFRSKKDNYTWLRHSDMVAFESRVKRTFDTFKQSPYLLEGIPQLSDSFRGQLEDLLDLDLHVSNLETFVWLSLKIQKDRPDSDFLSVTESWQFENLFRSEICKSPNDSGVTDFELELEACCSKFYSNYERRRAFRKLIIHAAVAIDKASVHEVVSRWSECEEKPGEASDLVAIARDWDKFKSYPLSWSLAIIEQDN